MPELLRHREDKTTTQQALNSADGRIESSHGGGAEPKAEVIDAEIVVASRAVPEPAAAAEHQAGQQEVISLQASETSAAVTQPAPRRTRSQAAAASAPSPAPAQVQAPEPAPAPDDVGPKN